jgi:hypothetical protein
MNRKDSAMNEQPAWQWNEMQQIGTDYANVAEV